MNIANALDAPYEGAWGMKIKESYIEEIAMAGFNSVRLPICWTAHISGSPPYSIDPNFLNRVDEILGWCFKRNLTVIITIHYFNELYDYPDDEINRQKFLSIWDQLTKHYLGTKPDHLIFEPLNEPHNNLTPEKWNKMIPEILNVIRKTDTDRTLIIDIAEWGYHTFIEQLKIPENERNVIVSVRYYLPYDFTNQGASWAIGSDDWRGISWTGTPGQEEAVIEHLEFIKKWSEKNNRPITIGEFGAIVEAIHEHRVIWTKFVRTQFEKYGFSWCYFDFGASFKAYNIEKNKWLKGFPDVFFDKH